MKRSAASQKRRKVVLPPEDYEPTQAEMEEEFAVDVPGDDIMEKMNNFASAIMRPVKIERKNY